MTDIIVSQDKTRVMEPLMVPLFHLELVKDRDLTTEQNAATTQQAAKVLHQLMDRSPTEMIVVLYLDSDSHIVGAEKVAMGSLESTANHIQEIFRGALVHGVPQMIISHFHPGTNTTPSIQDLEFTNNAIHMGEMLGVRVRDHLVLTATDHYSIRENWRKETQRLYQHLTQGTGFDLGNFEGVKDKILELITGGKLLDNSDLGDPLELGLKPKKKGDPKANLVNDATESLSHLWLVGR